MRGRRWVLWGVLVAVAAGVAAVVVVASSGPDVAEFERVLDAAVPGGVTGIALDDDTTYVASRTGVTAYRTGQDDPLWTSAGTFADAVDLAVLGDVLVVMAECRTGCGPLVGIDTATGERRWETAVASDTVLGRAGPYAAFQITDGQFLTDAVGVDLRDGDVVWRVARTEGHDRFAVTAGTDEVVHYAHDGTVRRFELATGDTVAEVDVPPYREGGSVELYASADAVVLQVDGPSDGLESTVFDRPGLRERWSRPARVHPVGTGTLFVASADGGEVVDAGGRTRWKVRTDVFLGAEGAGWGFGSVYSTSDASTVYLDLGDGGEILESDRQIAFREKEGVLLTTTLSGEGPVEFWYVGLPDGDEAELGSLDVFPGSCVFDHTRAACTDTGGHLGVWRYRG